ncbi:MAG TPA: ABC transporter ATP-binding protein [Acidimicrobiales bacterium]|nr:ABC transporter ATP-binding protein [Acidimicrobiales bacterium]
MNELEIAGLDKSYGAQGVLRNLSLDVATGTFVSILGPSGSGKTTLLRVIAGFERAERGSVRLGGTVVDDETHFVEAEGRRIGYVPQDGSLFPHLSVERNVGFGLARRERGGRRVAELLEMVGLGGMAKRYPHQLSGGQQQRVALARGLAIDPELVLLDEPFSSLDTSLRASVRHDVREVLKNAGTTAILVTHDQDEALSLADRVAIIREGRISQYDTPARIYAQPASPELAREFGDANFLQGVARSGRVDTPLGLLELENASSVEGGIGEGTKLLVLVRPEQFVIVTESDDAAGTARVLETEFYGHDAVLKLLADFDGTTLLTVRTSNAAILPVRDSKVFLELRGGVIGWPDA